MTASQRDFWVASEGGSGLEPSAEVVELALLLHRGQFSALERLAGARGISVARLLRHMIRDYLAHESGSTPASEARPGAETS